MAEPASRDRDNASTPEPFDADLFFPRSSYANRTARLYAEYREKTETLAARAEPEGKRLYEMDGWGGLVIDITYHLRKPDLADDARKFLAGL